MPTPLNRKNKHGVTVREGLESWYVTEAALCDETAAVAQELATITRDSTTVASV